MLAVQKDTLKKSIPVHSPRRATLLSLLPGAGQIYNHSYWKVPVIYAAFAGLGYLMKVNYKEDQNYVKEYKKRHPDALTTNPGDPNLVQYTDDNILTLKNAYERAYTLDIIGMAAVYILNIVDAAVDAHMYTFDVGDNLSLQMHPAFIYTAQNNLPKTGIGISLKF